MKRLSLFILFFLLISPVFAQSKPIFNPKILEAPGPIPGEKTVLPQVASKAPWGYAVNLARQAYQLITGEEGTTQQESFVIKTPNNRTDGDDIENATVWLTPKFLQDNYLKLVTYPQHMTANHVNCFYDEDGGSDHRPDEKIFHPPAIGWNKIRAVVVLAAFMTPFSLPLDGLNLFKEELDEKVLPDNGLPCGTQTENSKYIGLFDQGDNEQIYNEGDNMQWTASEFCPDLLEKYLSCLWNNATNPPDEEDEPCSLVCGGDAHTVYSTNLPAAKTKVNPRTGRIEDNVCTGYTCSYLSKQVNNSERLQFTHGENTQDHEINLGILSANTTSEQSVYYGEYSRRQAMIAKRCSNLSRNAPVFNLEECNFLPATPTPPQQACESTYFSQFTAGIEYSQKGKDADAGYTLPYRDASQSLTESMKEAAKKLAMEGYSGGSKAAENIDAYWDDINQTSKTNGWNPIFVVALWIEESGAGGHPNASHDLGCLYGWDKPNAQGPAVSMPSISDGSICDQMACLFSHPVKNKDDFSGFMCSYNSDPVSVGSYQCQASNGWLFPKNLKIVYDILINAK